eukprot:CAMPEP_0174729300 /NCGR_PEP_ID=MMETSP1094-20130205/53471_1 /TAXON_ID=156173 /ORGANISM="Chrysochromulina brevifilum, Strain UTEX LB 985" /LENGTH=70 /DNA_ID=CAMNT_0015931399 /DNA_START=29 /DNA_END=241 /DNA_ORIENTATION=-
MPPPQINRKRGKTLEQRRRDLGRMKKDCRKVAGKIAKNPLIDRPPPSKKKLKKKLQRQKLLSSNKDDMEQ